MAGRTQQTFKKRQKEQQRREKQQEKFERRMQRKHEPQTGTKPEDELQPLDGPLPIEPLPPELDDENDPSPGY